MQFRKYYIKNLSNVCNVESFYGVKLLGRFACLVDNVIFPIVNIYPVHRISSKKERILSLQLCRPHTCKCKKAVIGSKGGKKLRAIF